MKIVIVGGGTAGWLTAVTLANQNAIYKEDNSEHYFDVTVIDSSNIPIIGAGEGSTGVFFEFIKNRINSLNLDELKFLYEANATLKLGIRFKDWNGVGTEYASPIQPTETTLNIIDRNFLFFANEGDFAESSLSGFFMQNDLSTFSISGKNNAESHSYHFDAFDVGKYFKKVCLENGITHIDSDVIDINLDSENGHCKSVSLKNGQTIEGDIWIDCTGFARILLNKMNCGWKSYSDFLPTNNALPYVHKFDDLKDVKMETLAWAQPNGWMWQIPTQQRYGCGYVYSDMFTNADNALKELQENTGRKIEPLRNLKFDVGRVEKFWEKNVVGIGLSTGFLEPLQATSIHTTIIQIDLFIINYLQNNKKDTIIDNQIKRYNQHVGKMIDDFSDLIRMQYVVDREDTDFWKYCKYELPKTEKVKEILEICKHRVPNVYDWDVYHGGAGWGVWCWTLIGSGLITKELIQKALKRRSLDMYSKSEYQRMRKQVQNVSVKLKSQHKFLQDLINKKL